MRLEVEQKGLTIILKNKLPENSTIIKTDKDKVLAILYNLIKNAIKFTKTGTIEFGCICSSSANDSTHK